MRIEENPQIRPCRSCKSPELVRDMMPARLVRWFGRRDPKARGYYCAKCVWRMESHGSLISTQTSWSDHLKNISGNT